MTEILNWGILSTSKTGIQKGIPVMKKNRYCNTEPQERFEEIRLDVCDELESR